MCWAAAPASPRACSAKCAKSAASPIPSPPRSPTFEHASYLYGGTTTKNERAHELLEVIRDEILDMARGDISEDELDKGKHYLIGSYPLRFDTSTKIAGQLVHIQLDGYGVDWLIERNARIAAVTMADAKRAAERMFGDGALQRGDGRAAGEGLRRPAFAAFQSVNCLIEPRRHGRA